MDIKVYENNVKKHPDEQLKLLADLIARFGWRSAIMVNRDDTIIAGHGRWLAYQKFKDTLNLKEPWIINDSGVVLSGGPETQPMTPEDETLYRIADNKVTEMAMWDNAILSIELSKLSAPSVDLSGFSPTINLGLEATPNLDLIPTPQVDPDAVHKKRRQMRDVMDAETQDVICPECSYEFTVRVHGN